MRVRHQQADRSIAAKTYRRIISGHAPPAWGTSHPGSADQLKDGQRSSKHSNPEEENPSTSTASGRVTIMSESIAAMSPSPHQDDRLLKIPIKNDRIFGYTGFCTKSGLGAVAAGSERPPCCKLFDGRRVATRQADNRPPLKRTAP